jgi:SAM-dependent methyltransferase
MYESTIATHYAAYRPPLHKTILENVFAASRKRHIGLDIGCGTGSSTYALAKYCTYVVGIDPSMEMLRGAEAQQSINYINALGEKIPIADNSIDVVSMAGSLNYINRKLFVSELCRVCCREAEIVVYDFEVDLLDFESLFKLENLSNSLEYNHQVNLSGFPEVEEFLLASDEVLFDLSSCEIAHLLLSDIDRHRALQKIYSTGNLFELVKAKIETDETMLTLKANIYYSLYSLAEN